jgi:hypothetical protein
MTRMHSTGRVVVGVLCIAGLLVLGYVTYVVVDAKIYRPIEHRQLEKASPSAVARAIGHPARDRQFMPGSRSDPGVGSARSRRVRPDLNRGAEGHRVVEAALSSIVR